MTPDDVVARAKELVGQRVHLTVEGVVHTDSVRVWLPGRPDAIWIMHGHLPEPRAAENLVSIEPAPVRIDPGQLYIDDNGKFWKGGPDRADRPNGLLWGFGNNSTFDYEPSRMPGLRAVRVVDA